MRKYITCGIAAVLCALAISTQAFANTLENTSIYADDRKEIAGSSKILEQEGEAYYIDPNTVTPVYEADILEYARTGSLELKRLVSGNNAQRYISDALDQNGNYTGLLSFSVKEGVPAFGSLSFETDKKRSAAFAPNAKRLTAVMTKRNINTDCKDVKLVFINGLGYVYYIDNGTSQYLAASNISSANGDLFKAENGGIVEIGEELKAFADKELVEYEEWQKYLSTLPPGENPPSKGGKDVPEFIVDNTPYLDSADASSPSNDVPNTGSSNYAAVLAAELGLISAMIIGGAVVRKKRKNDR